jgi:hypothetical protein
MGAEGLRGEFKGDPIAIQRGADEDGAPLDPVDLYFLGTNYRTAQGYHGDVIIDECFWIYGFEELFKVASAMATHKIYTRTLFSTPSTLAHEAYPMWSGDRFNKRRAKRDRIKIDISHDHLKAGALGADGIWRQIVTVFDAIEGGFDLVDVEELQREYAVDEFDNLFRCLFLDDSQSMFPFEIMRRCMVDSWDVWRDVQPYAARPTRARSGWAMTQRQRKRTGDDAALVAVAPPSSPAASSASWKRSGSRASSSTSRPPRSARWPSAIASPGSPSTPPARARRCSSSCASGSRWSPRSPIRR